MATKAKYLQWRATEEDRALVQELADEYGVSISELFRFAVKYVDTHRPPMEITTVIRPSKKATAEKN